MENYPRLIYCSASWRGANQALEVLLVRELAHRGFTLIGDHHIHKTQDTGRKLHWQQRIDDVVAGCHGIVAILQKTDDPQTTSPYQFPELLMASRHHLPLLIVHPTGIQVCKRSLADKGYSLVFGDSETLTSITLPTRERTSGGLLAPQNCFSDETLASANSLDLPDVPFLPDPIEHTEQVVTERLSRQLDAFVSELTEGVPSYVFNVIPFTRQRQHKIIAQTVFREVGMPCYTALDRPQAGSSREHWRTLLSEASLVIADLDLRNGNCVFEAGVAFAMSDGMHIVHSGQLRHVPFGLDDVHHYPYKNDRQLGEQVARICLPFKRTVFNLDKLEVAKDEPVPGVPDWLAGSGAKDDVAVRVQAVLLIVAAGGLFAIAGYLQQWMALTIAGTAVVGAGGLAKALSGLVPQVSKDLDDRFVQYASRIWWIGAFLLAVAAVACIAAAWIHVVGPSKEAAEASHLCCPNVSDPDVIDAASLVAAPSLTDQIGRRELAGSPPVPRDVLGREPF